MKKIMKHIGVTLTALLVAGVIFAGGAYANEVWAGRGNAEKTESNITLVGEMFKTKNNKIKELKTTIGDKEQALSQKDQALAEKDRAKNEAVAEKQKEVDRKQQEVDRKQQEVNTKQQALEKALQDLETYKQNNPNQSGKVSKLEEQLRQAEADVKRINENLQGVINQDVQDYKE